MDRFRPGNTLFRLSLFQLIVLIILVVVSTIIVNNRKPTSKMTWEVSRGIPFTVVVTDEYEYGGPGKPVLFHYPGTVKNFSLVGLLLNFASVSLAFFLVSFLVIFLVNRQDDFLIGSQ